jgi:8-oxo-dGTP pyrophosphatase MutT (NUDIX family)
MECVNCNKSGHTFRDCTEPVTSFGVIAVKFVTGVPHYLMICRRDSLAFVEFMRGKYKLDNRPYIQLLMNNMTADERSRLQTQQFDILWNNVWNGQNTRQYRNEYESARRMFDTFKQTGDVYGRLMSKYIEDVHTSWAEPEWGFPKGRRGSIRETELKCALREFTEETGIPNKVLHVLPGQTFVEEYDGTNGIRYRQVYVLAGCKPDVGASVQPYNHVMNREVGNIGWFTYESAHARIRETNKEKREMLTQIHTQLVDASSHLYDSLQTVLEWTLSGTHA